MRQGTRARAVKRSRPTPPETPQSSEADFRCWELTENLQIPCGRNRERTPRGAKRMTGGTAGEPESQKGQFLDWCPPVLGLVPSSIWPRDRMCLGGGGRGVPYQLWGCPHHAREPGNHSHSPSWTGLASSGHSPRPSSGHRLRMAIECWVSPAVWRDPSTIVD